ncbi:MAG: acyl-CoA dehydrogenase, partial [Hyphomicrobiaceae bacterium]|nr:acyl-CoA dehydrogenase [Hyphomicrobiaceae bacterium]
MAEAALSARSTSFEVHGGAIAAAERVLGLAKSGVRQKQAAAATPDAAQHALHGLAWLATYVEALRQMLGWARGLADEGRLGEMEHLLLDAAFGEYLAQIVGGIPMSQVEMVRLGQLGV